MEIFNFLDYMLKNWPFGISIMSLIIFASKTNTIKTTFGFNLWAPRKGVSLMKNY